MEFSSQQAATLYSIADQCPLVGGNPVYQARALYALIDEDADFDDALLCIAEGFVVKSLVEPSLSVQAYPNPNRTGQLFFEIDGLDEGDRSITVLLFDMQGRPVVQQPLAGWKGSADVSRLAQGLYHWTVLLDGQRIGQGKVTLF
ncbi:MAG: T9SS type A sorting domain-containing protein [Flavobacteriales bacterium]|nr:T9SS type A sorting domain-containing protein [Flavobacteriales bacterium]